MKKIHKLDKIFIIGIAIIGIIGGIVDGFYWLPYEGEGGFPTNSCISIYITYILWIILLIYSNIKYDKENKPEYVRWYGYFLNVFMQLPFILIGWFLAYIILKVINII